MSPISIMSTNTKNHVIILHIGGKFIKILTKLGELMCQFCVCYIICTCVNMKQLETE